MKKQWKNVKEIEGAEKKRKKEIIKERKTERKIEEKSYEENRKQSWIIQK